MALTDPIADMLTTIRNGQNVMLASVSCPASNARARLLDVLRDEGFVQDYAEEEVRKGVKRFNINLRYHEGRPVIRNLKRISKPGRRVYKNANELPKVNNGLGVAIISTSSGVLPDYKARELGVGGEVICEVF